MILPNGKIIYIIVRNYHFNIAIDDIKTTLESIFAITVSKIKTQNNIYDTTITGTVLSVRECSNIEFAFIFEVIN